MKKLWMLLLLLCSFAVGQVNTTNIDDFPAGSSGCSTTAIWCNVHDVATGGTSTGTTVQVSSPSKDGQAREYDIAWTSTGGHRFSANFGSLNLDSTSTMLTMDLWFRITSWTHVHALEIDFNQVLNNGDTVIFGHQCNSATGFWQTTSKISGSPAWTNTSATCNPTVDLAVNVWHHIIIKDVRDEFGTGVSYNTITVDGVTQAFGGSPVASNFSLAWGAHQQVVNFQIDGDGTSGSTVAYLDSFTVSMDGLIDDFSAGSLDTKRWHCDTGGAPGGIVGANAGTFDCGSTHFNLSGGMLDMALTQIGTAPTNSVGAELRSNNRYSYGEYHVEMRAASTATSSAGSGSCASGQVSTPFLFFTNSQGEIDMPEITGDACNTLQYTTWKGLSTKEADSTTLTGPEQAFHDYGMIWSPAKVDFYVDGTLVATHTGVVPNIPLWFMVSLWGTNNAAFGGVSTPGTVRHQYIRKMTFTPAGNAPAPPTGLGATVT